MKSIKIIASLLQIQSDLKKLNQQNVINCISYLIFITLIFDMFRLGWIRRRLSINYLSTKALKRAANSLFFSTFFQLRLTCEYNFKKSLDKQFIFFIYNL